METTTEVATSTRKARKKADGQVVRVSPLTWDTLRRKLREGESMDSLLRRILNLPNRKGIKPGLFECHVLRSTGVCYPSEAKARGASIMQTVGKGHKGLVEKPIRVREVV